MLLYIPIIKYLAKKYIKAIGTGKNMAEASLVLMIKTTVDMTVNSMNVTFNIAMKSSIVMGLRLWLQFWLTTYPIANTTLGFMFITVGIIYNTCPFFYSICFISYDILPLP